MKRYLGIAALSLALAFGFSMVTANIVSAEGFGYPEELEIVSEEAKGTAVEKQYKVLEPIETEEELNFEKAAEEAGAGM